MVFELFFYCVTVQTTNTRVNSPNHSYPRVAVFQKLRSLAQSKAKPKQSLIPQLLLSKKGFIYTCPSFFSIKS